MEGEIATKAMPTRIAAMLTPMATKAMVSPNPGMRTIVFSRSMESTRVWPRVSLGHAFSV